jgi:tetratricopeptide (TPR) repeat protein
MIAAFLLSGALTAQVGDPYAVMRAHSALHEVCVRGDAALADDRADEAIEDLLSCHQSLRRPALRGPIDLSDEALLSLLRHIAKQLVRAYERVGDEQGAAQFTGYVDTYEEMIFELPDQQRISQAMTAFDQGDYRTAEAIWLILLAEAEAGENRTGSVSSRRHQLAGSLMPQGRSAEAIPLLEQARAELEARDSRQLLLQVRNDLAEAYFDVGRYDDSADILSELYAEHGGVIFSNNLARALDGAGRHAEAEALLRNSLASARATDGQMFVSRYGLARVIFNLARSLAAQGEHAEAGALFTESAGLTVERRPPGHTDIIAAHSFLVRHRLLAEADASGALSASRTLSANLNAYLSGSTGQIDRSQPIQNAGAPDQLFTLHVEAAWAVAQEDRG